MLEKVQSEQLDLSQIKKSSLKFADQSKSKNPNAFSHNQETAFKGMSNKEAMQAIIILGGGRQRGALDLLEYQYQNLSPQSIERLRAGATLARVTNLPILLSGGTPDRVEEKDLSEARIMNMVLKQELGIQARWLEEQSNTTQENALQSAKILNQEGIKNIYLVTHFWHIPRAKAQFEKQGLKVIEVSSGFYL